MTARSKAPATTAGAPNPAQEIGRLAQRILKLAPSAGLHVGITINAAAVREAQMPVTHPETTEGLDR